MNSIIKKILNPIELIRAFKFHKKQKNHKKSSEDLELMLYSKIIRNDMLHYGYFDNPDVEPDSISIKDLENAQMRYVEILIKQISDTGKKVLDVGCGMGGLSNILLEKGFQVESLTPDNNQKNYITSKYKQLKVHHMKFEDFKSESKFNTVINSESLQYIDLDKAFDLVPEILSKNGKLIIIAFQGGFEKKINMLPILTKWLTITGSTLRPRSVEEKGNIADQLYKKVWPIIEKKLVMPQIYGTYNLKDANKAHAAIEASDHIGKIILTNT